MPRQLDKESLKKQPAIWSLHGPPLERASPFPFSGRRAKDIQLIESQPMAPWRLGSFPSGFGNSIP